MFISGTVYYLCITEGVLPFQGMANYLGICGYCFTQLFWGINVLEGRHRYDPTEIWSTYKISGVC